MNTIAAYWFLALSGIEMVKTIGGNCQVSELLMTDIDEYRS